MVAITNPAITAVERSSLESTLKTLISQVEATRNALLQNGQRGLLQTLHTDKDLPDSAVEALAGKAINILHETKQLLEPGHLVLADHFLGKSLISIHISFQVPTFRRIRQHQVPLCCR